MIFIISIPIIAGFSGALKILTEQSLSNIIKVAVVGHLSEVERGYGDNGFHELPSFCRGPRVNINTLSLGVLDG